MKVGQPTTSRMCIESFAVWDSNGSYH